MTFSDKEEWPEASLKQRQEKLELDPSRRLPRLPITNQQTNHLFTDAVSTNVSSNYLPFFLQMADNLQFNETVEHRRSEQSIFCCCFQWLNTLFVLPNHITANLTAHLGAHTMSIFVVPMSTSLKISSSIINNSNTICFSTILLLSVNNSIWTKAHQM